MTKRDKRTASHYQLFIEGPFDSEAFYNLPRLLYANQLELLGAALRAEKGLVSGTFRLRDASGTSPTAAQLRRVRTLFRRCWGPPNTPALITIAEAEV